MSTLIFEAKILKYAVQLTPIGHKGDSILSPSNGALGGPIREALVSIGEVTAILPAPKGAWWVIVEKKDPIWVLVDEADWSLRGKLAFPSEEDADCAMNTEEGFKYTEAVELTLKSYE